VTHWGNGTLRVVGELLLGLCNDQPAEACDQRMCFARKMLVLRAMHW
jgi:hypothetical protein